MFAPIVCPLHDCFFPTSRPRCLFDTRYVFHASRHVLVFQTCFCSCLPPTLQSLAPQCGVLPSVPGAFCWSRVGYPSSVLRPLQLGPLWPCIMLRASSSRAVMGSSTCCCDAQCQVVSKHDKGRRGEWRRSDERGGSDAVRMEERGDARLRDETMRNGATRRQRTTHKGWPGLEPRFTLHTSKRFPFFRRRVKSKVHECSLQPNLFVRVCLGGGWRPVVAVRRCSARVA